MWHRRPPRTTAFQPPYLPDAQAVTYFNSFMVELGIFLVFYLFGNRIPKTWPLQTLGDISYPVYLSATVIGWTILAWLTRSFDSYFWALPVAAAAVLAIAFVLHKLVEKPTYAVAQRITARPRFRSDRSWSDQPRPRRRRAEPDTTEPVPAPSPAPAPIGLNLAASDGNGHHAGLAVEAAPSPSDPTAEL